MKAILAALAVVVTVQVFADDTRQQAPDARSLSSDARRSTADQPAAVPSDTVRLVNGDQLTGRVVSMDADKIVLESGVLGKLTLPRKQVAEIQIGASRSPSPDQSIPAQGSVERQRLPPQPRISDGTLIKELQARGLPLQKLEDLRAWIPDISLPESKQTPEDVMRQLRTQGISQADLNDVQSQVPLLALPGVRSYFDQTLHGLITGRLDLHDIRRDATKAREGLKDIQKDLGPNGAALNGYLMILESFLEQTRDVTTTLDSPDPAGT